MYDTFEAAVMDDLFYDAMENPAQSRSRTYDAYDDSFDAYGEDIDEAVYRVFRSRRVGFHVDSARVDIEGDPNAIRNALTGQDPNVVGVWVTGGPRNAGWVARQAGFPRTIAHQGHPVGRGIPVGQPHLHGVDSSGRESESHIFYGRAPEGDFADFDAFEDAMADALEVEDTDEFFRRLVRGMGRVTRGIGRVARVVAPIASAIPLPWTEAIGRVARAAGRLLADGADEFEAIDALVDLAEVEDLMDAAAPVVASMAIHGTMPQAARLPASTRQQLLRTTVQTAQTLARQQGPQAVRALPAVVQAAQRATRQQGLPPRALPRLVQRMGMRLSRNPQMLHRLLQSARPALRQQLCAACRRSHARPAARRPAL